MKDRELNMYVIILCLLLVLGWMFVIYAPLRQEVQHNQNMINRAENRIQTRGSLPEQPEQSETGLKKDLEQLMERQEALRLEFSQYETRFVPLDTVEGIKSLRLEIASLAEWTGLEVVTFGGGGNVEISDSLDAIKEQIRQPFGRPVMNFEANGSFRQIAQFVESIGDIERAATILRLEIIAPDYEAMIDDPATAGLLNVKMEIAL